MIMFLFPVNFVHDDMNRSMRNLSLGFPTRSDTNQAVQPQKMARGLRRRGIILSM